MFYHTVHNLGIYASVTAKKIFLEVDFAGFESICVFKFW